MDKTVCCEEKIEPILSSGTYKAYLDRCTKLETSYGKRVNFIFKLLDVEDGLEVQCSTGVNLNPQSRLYDVVTGLLGRELSSAELESFDLSQLEGMNCVLFIELARSKDGFRFNDIVKVIF